MTLWKRFLQTFLVFAVVVGGFLVIAWLQKDIDHFRQNTQPDSLLFLPPSEVWHAAVLGHDAMAADLLWLEGIQLLSCEFDHRRKVAWIYRVFDLITDLDPYFISAYRFGGIFLDIFEKKSRLSIQLLEKGMMRNPDDYTAYYEAAMLSVISYKDRAAAIRYLRQGVRKKNFPDWLPSTLAVYLSKEEGFEEARRLLVDMGHQSNMDGFRQYLRSRLEVLWRDRARAMKNNPLAYANLPPEKQWTEEKFLDLDYRPWENDNSNH